MRQSLEGLENYSGLISGIDYDERSKTSFFNAVHDWSHDLGSDLSIEKWSSLKGMGFALKQIYGNIIEPNKEHTISKRVYSVAAPLINLPQIPLFGMWIYIPDQRKIISGNALQRLAISCLQGDLVVHEYLHAYEQNLHDFLLNGGIIKEQANPASIVEPRQLGFQFYPPSKKYLEKLEKRILRRLDKKGQIIR